MLILYSVSGNSIVLGSSFTYGNSQSSGSNMLLVESICQVPVGTSNPKPIETKFLVSNVWVGATQINLPLPTMYEF